MTTVRSPIGKARRFLRALNRRANHLQERVDADPGLSYDQRELSALRWAIRELMPTAGDGFTLDDEKRVA